MGNNTLKSLTMDVSSKTENVTRVVQTLEKFCNDNNVDRKITEPLLVATDEAITNIVIHAYQRKPNGEISVYIELNTSSILVELRNVGDQFNPGKIEKREPEEIDKMKVGGYGLILMNSLLDELDFSYDKRTNTNILTMRKKF